MSAPRSDAVRTGAFVLVVAVAAAAFVAVYVGRDLASEKRTYYAVFERSVAGLAPGAPVQYRGVPVGSVGDVQLAGESFPDVRVALRVAEGVPVLESTVARLERTLLTGRALVQLSGGRAGDPTLEPGSEIATGVSDYQRLYESLSAAASRLPRSLEKLESATERVEAFFDSEGDSPLTSALRSIEETSRSTQERLQELAGLSETTEEELVETGRAARQSLLELGDELSRSMDEIVAGLRRVARSLDEGAAAELGRLLRESTALVRDLRADPGRLLFSTPPPGRPIPDPVGGAPR